MENKTPELSGNKWLSLYEKQEIVRDWKKSGLSKHQFCKSRKIITTTFYGWCRQVTIAAGKVSGDLTPVAVVKKSANLSVRHCGDADAEICLPNQTIIRLRLPIDTLIAVIEGLSNASHAAR